MSVARAAWRRFVRRGRILTIELVGIASVVVGVWLVYEPAAFIIGGAGAVLWAIGAERDDHPGDDDARDAR